MEVVRNIKTAVEEISNFNAFRELISANEGIKKPDKKIFKILLDRYLLEPQECLLFHEEE